MDISKDDKLAHQRVKSMLDYAEQLIRLDENVVTRLSQLRLADGSQFILHQHELHGLPGISFDKLKDEGAVWLRIERLVRTRPPEPATEIAEWINVSSDLNKICEVYEVLRKRVLLKDRDLLLAAGKLLEGEFQSSLSDQLDSSGQSQFFDLAVELEKRPVIREAVEAYLSQWQAWSETEQPRRLSMVLYQRLFSVA